MSARKTGSSSVPAIVLALVVAVFVWWSQAGPGSTTDASTERASDSGRSGQSQPQRAPRAGASTDATSGLPWIAAGDLPPEARDTLLQIDDGGPFPEDEDDQTFGNFEGLLPDEPRDYYREYTVRTPGVESRGARRIVTGDGGQYYWTADHYQSFSRIRR